MRILRLSILAVLAGSLLGEPGERIAFDAALRIFDREFYREAEEEFSDFVKDFPESELIPRANAFRLRSRAHRLSQEGDHAAAADAFRELRLAHPNSPNYLEYVVEEAWNEYRNGGRDSVLELLGGIGSPFQAAAVIRPNDPSALPFLVGGRLLLAQTLLDREEYAGARRTLSEISDWYLGNEFVWRRRLLLARLHLAEGVPEKALEHAESALELAMVTAVPEWITESAAVLGEVRIASGRPEAAIAAYRRNLVPGVPVRRKQEAWSRLVELHLGQRPPGVVIGILEDLLAELPEEVHSDIPLLALGRLKLELHFREQLGEGSGTASPEDLIDARDLLSRVIGDFPESGLLAHAYFHVGWCHWELGAVRESIDAFSIASDLLSPGVEQAVARFKVADGLLAEGRYGEAVERYRDISPETVPEFPAREHFLARVLYQLLRAAVKVPDASAATEAVRELVTRYPEDLLSVRGRIVAGRYLMDTGKGDGARELFRQVVEQFPSFPLRPEVEFAIAGSHEREGNWQSALEGYRRWLEDYPGHALRPRVVYSLARSTGRRGDQEEAFRLFGRLIEEHGESPQAGSARLWRGNFHFNRHRFVRAEAEYRRILEDDGLSAAMECRVRLMAARAAFRLGRYRAAIDTLEPVHDRRHSLPADLMAEVGILYGDACFEHGRELEGDERLEQFCNALAGFWRAETAVPSARLAAVAQGRSGNLGYLMAHYPMALHAFGKVIGHPEADIAQRSEARVAVGMIHERLFEEEGFSPRKDPLDDYREVIFRKNLRQGERFDPFWIQQAALKACAIMETRGDFPAAVRICEEMARILPPRARQWENLRDRLANLEE